MKPTSLLDFWQKPAGAGAPVALFATTYALESDFFEQNCLARFLEVSSVDELTGSVNDIVASVELQELLQNVCVTVLADRSAPVQRSSLLWDLLGCKVEGGLLHAKVSVLIWENATRVVLGSANLTSAGYRRQIELGLAADLGPNCLFSRDVLEGIAEELGTYLPLIPGYDINLAVFKRASNTLDLFRRRISIKYSSARSAIRVAFAPTNATANPLSRLDSVWNGPQPLRATHLSPFWDSNDEKALVATSRLLTGRPVTSRAQKVGVVLTARGEMTFPKYLAGFVNSVHLIKKIDQEIRPLHAKCLIIESNEWVAALVGSSNHTKAGLGLDESRHAQSHTRPRRHREINVWIGASKTTKEGKALLDLIQLGKAVTVDSDTVVLTNEDEVELTSLPACFGICRIQLSPGEQSRELQLGIASTEDMPINWEIGFAVDDPPILTCEWWEKKGKLEATSILLGENVLPMFVFVRWNGNTVPWAVVAEDRQSLPLGSALSSLSAQHLLDALATGRSLTDVLRRELEHKNTKNVKSGIDLDPLTRLEVEGSLLRRGRALAASLSAMQRRLERSVVTTETLSARLAGPLGPTFVATKVLEAVETNKKTRAEAIFTIAEIALTIGRINWDQVFEHINSEVGIKKIGETLDRLDALRVRAGAEPSEIASYACRAFNEARKCLIR